MKAGAEMNPSQRIDQMVAEITDWRAAMFTAVRKAVLAADPEIVEEWKWMGSPVWYRDGIIAVASAHQGTVKLTFAYGARFSDADKLFNAGLDGNARRAIDFLEGDAVDQRKLTRLVRAAIAFNQSKSKKKPAATPRAKKAKRKPS
jgi:hypothetical protein